MTRESFIKKRNKAFKGSKHELVCDFCGEQCTTYMGFVTHRHDKHGVKPGDADIYKKGK